MLKKVYIITAITLFLFIGGLYFLIAFGQKLKITYKDPNNNFSNPEVLFENSNGKIVFYYSPYFLNEKFDEIHLRMSDCVNMSIKSIKWTISTNAQNITLDELRLIPSKYLSETDEIVLNKSTELENNPSLQKYYFETKSPIKELKLPEKFSLKINLKIKNQSTQQIHQIDRVIEVENGTEWTYHGIWMH